MVFKTFQNSKLSALGFGAMRLPVLNGDDGQVDEAAVAQMVDRAMAAGVNYYDTAWGITAGTLSWRWGVPWAAILETAFTWRISSPVTTCPTWTR